MDSVTDLDGRAPGAVLVSGSHGGLFSGRAAAAAGVRAAVFNDAGGGRDGAGVAGLALLAGCGVAAVAVGADSARIGDGRDVWHNGVTTACNAVAAECGVTPGMACRAAVEAMAANDRRVTVPDPPARPARALVVGAPVRVWALDSASLVRSTDDGAVLATGSHGGLPGTDPARALRCRPALVAFNDAGVGKDGAGTGRLAVLDDRGVAAVTVAAASARIGDGRSTLVDGVLSRVNGAAARLGAVRGTALAELVDELVGGGGRG
ncbi:hypothetical protein [Pseudonocardia humida]|uniref:Uncharacterized protein n=1 Tax=Pseudonocardia humida TaxID=2800819 RepID=A0ABT1A663_9PSEU|nr:hypothetical protein [Pseudonocardia humida]MCO1658513.1 hypothetical protein [Pseudonocardia humida]